MNLKTCLFRHPKLITDTKQEKDYYLLGNYQDCTWLEDACLEFFSQLYLFMLYLTKIKTY